MPGREEVRVSCFITDAYPVIFHANNWGHVLFALPLFYEEESRKDAFRTEKKPKSNMGQMKFGAYFSPRKFCQRKIKVYPRGKYNALYDGILFQLLLKLNFIMQNEKEIILFSLLHKFVTKEIFCWFIHSQALCPDLSVSLLLPVLRLQCHSLPSCKVDSLQLLLYFSLISLNYWKGYCQVEKNISSKIK